MGVDAAAPADGNGSADSGGITGPPGQTSITGPAGQTDAVGQTIQTGQTTQTGTAAKPPLTRSEIIAFVNSYTKDKREILSGRGRSLLFFHDMAGDGYPEILMVLVETEIHGSADIGYLSSYARIYGADPVSFEVSVLFLPQTEKGIGQPVVIPLGKRLSIQSVRTFRLIDGQEKAICVEVLFADQEGTEREIVTFSDTASPSVLSIHDSPAGAPLFEDMDGDSVIDILVPTQGLEEGTGYETYLIWYRWSRGKFVENRSVNIVRNLNLFLDTCSRFLREGKWEAFCAAAYNPRTVSALRRQGLSYFSIAMKGFTLTGVPEGAPFVSPFLEKNPPVSVVFPVLLENPFNLGKGLPAIVPISARFSTPEQGDFLYSLRIVLAENPFEKQQYYIDLH